MTLKKHIERRILFIYPQILDFTFRIVNALKGSKSDYRWLDCEKLAMKIFLHSVTIDHIKNGSNLTLSVEPKESHVIDFPSMMVITRTILETYLNMFEVFFEPKNDDLFSYRHGVFRIEGLRSKETFEQREQNIQSFTHPELDKIRQDIQHTQHYKSLDKNQQKASRNGSICPKRSIGEIAYSAGFSEKYIENLYMILSAYAHGDYFSAFQIKGATDADRRGNITSCLINILIILSLMITNYVQKFPEAKAVFDADVDNAKLVKEYVRQAKGL